MNTRPNIVFIIADQHNAKLLGCAGHPQVKTPHLDQMAAKGVRYDAAICQNPICTPSRVSFLSGQYCHNHGYYGLDGPNPNGLPNILGHFRRHGYTTAAIGKIHCPAHWIEDDCDVFHETCNCSIGGRSKAYEKFLSDAGKLDQEDHLVMNDLGPRGRQSMESRPSQLTFEQSQEGWIANQSLTFMQQAADQHKPYFLFASLPRPHQCTAPSEPFWSMYNDKEPLLPPNADYDMSAAGKAPHLIQRANSWRSGDWTLIEPRTFEAGRQRKMHGYLAAISQVDHAVGQLLGFLESAGLGENTIVIYSSDHGDYACEHGIMEKAPGICADAITRVPMIWKWDGHFAAGHLAEDVVEHVDIAPTLCGLAGVPLLQTTDGRDLSSTLHGKAGDADRCGFTEFAWSKSIRHGRYRLVHYPQSMFAQQHPQGFGELYDLQSDPWEMRNLFFDPEHQHTVTLLKHKLTDWLIQSTRVCTTLADAMPTGPQWVHRHKHTVLADNKIGPREIAQVKDRMTSYL